MVRSEENMDGSISIDDAKAWVVRCDPNLSNAFMGALKRVKATNLEALQPSADWVELFAPFGRVRETDAKDPRLLVPEWGPF